MGLLNFRRVKNIEAISVPISKTPKQIVSSLSMLDARREDRLPIKFPSFSPSDEVNTDVNRCVTSFCFDLSMAW